MLSVHNLEASYHRASPVLKGLSLSVGSGEVVALLGANGAGKSTLLKAVSGLLSLENGNIDDGEIRFDDRPANRTAPHILARSGLLHVREGRRVFAEMTVEENLHAATNALTGRSRKSRDDDGFERVYHYFPRLKERARQYAGLLSGGEQQMLAIGRALIGRPRLMLLDEPSLGLAPKVVDEIFSVIGRINREQQVSMLLVEQNAVAAFSLAQRGYILESGKVVLEGEISELRENPDIQTFYLGLGESDGKEGQKSFRDVKHYKRRKRWLN